MELTRGEQKELDAVESVGYPEPCGEDFKVLVNQPGLVLLKSDDKITYVVETRINGIKLRKLG